MVVDDNRDAADTLSLILKLTGNKVRTAYSGIEAIKTAEEFKPMAILMDVGMSNLNGYDATQRIRAEPWGGDMIIIALTGWGQEQDRLRSKEAGCDGHLVKPINAADLETLLVNLETARSAGISAPPADFTP